MNSTWLIQRLNWPYPAPKGSPYKDNLFSFGGGYKNGGLSENIMSILRPLFSFDYMGSAEFEYGALPDALRRMATNPGLRYEPVDLTMKDGTHVTVYCVFPEELREGVLETLRSVAREDIVLKESSMFVYSVNKYSERGNERNCGDTIGWIELDNGFAFFIDKSTADKFASMFGVLSADTQAKK
jgi:hypothetical protein